MVCVVTEPRTVDTIARLVTAVTSGHRSDALELLTEDFVASDRRRLAPLGDRADRVEYVERMLMLRELTDDLRGTIDVVDERDGAVQVVFAWHGALRQGGGTFETAYRIVAGFRSDGRLFRVDLFDADDVAAAAATLRSV